LRRIVDKRLEVVAISTDEKFFEYPFYLAEIDKEKLKKLRHNYRKFKNIFHPFIVNLYGDKQKYSKKNKSDIIDSGMYETFQIDQLTGHMMLDDWSHEQWIHEKRTSDTTHFATNAWLVPKSISPEEFNAKSAEEFEKSGERVITSILDLISKDLSMLR